MSTLEILIAARERVLYAWAGSIREVLAHVAWRDSDERTDTFGDVWVALFDALPDAVRRTFGPEVYTDDEVEAWEDHEDVHLSGVIELFDVAIKAASW